MFELMDSFSQTAVIKVIGVGGGGGNAVSHMAKCGIEGVEFICVNTDAQALKHSQVKQSLQIGWASAPARTRRSGARRRWRIVTASSS
jgi:cell division protein FtsZ